MEVRQSTLAVVEEASSVATAVGRRPRLGCDSEILVGELLGVEGLAYLTFYVEDIEATVAACLQAGGKPVDGTEPVDVGEMKIAFLRDPEGNVVELVERAARRGG